MASTSSSSSSPSTRSSGRLAAAATSSSSSSSSGGGGGNPLAFLGLKRVGDEEESDATTEAGPPKSGKSAGGVELNNRGLPARKRKRNSLIYGADEVVSLPVRSPKKKQPPPQSPTKKEKAKSKSVPASVEKKKQLVVVTAETFSPVKDKRTPVPASTSKLELSRNSTARVKLNLDDPSLEAEAKEPSSPLKLSHVRRNLTASPKKSPAKRSPVKKPSSVMDSPSAKRLEDFELTNPEKKAAQALGVALRNLLKLPKAHKWVCYEFFYSNVDRVLFEGENDFMVCLRESFPQLKTRRLTRVEWCKVRRLMGKPRRCSAAFFAEERTELARKRHKIRLLQQRKQGDVANYKDLPENIPLQLTIGARVTARLRKPQDGLFTGTVDGYDTSNNTYRITFDRLGLGTHSIPDFAVRSTHEPETMPLAEFTAKARPRPIVEKMHQQQQQLMLQHQQLLGSPYKFSPLKLGAANTSGMVAFSPQLANDPLLSGSTPRGKVMRMDGNIGGHQVKFLAEIVRLSKCLKLKRERVTTLSELNSLGERKKSFGEYISEDFQRKYAATVMELAQINSELNEYLGSIREFTQKLSYEAGPTISLPNIIREGCHEDAYDLVNRSNNSGNPTSRISEEEESGEEDSPSAGKTKEFVENPKILALISSLTALMLHVKQLAHGERNAFELQALQDSLSEIKSGLHASNLGKFENCIEVHMEHIQSGLSQLGNLSAFNNCHSTSNK